VLVTLNVTLSLTFSPKANRQWQSQFILILIHLQ